MINGYLVYYYISDNMCFFFFSCRIAELYVHNICCFGSCICYYYCRNCYCQVDWWTNSNAEVVSFCSWFGICLGTFYISASSCHRLCLPLQRYEPILVLTFHCTKHYLFCPDSFYNYFPGNLCISKRVRVPEGWTIYNSDCTKKILRSVRIRLTQMLFTIAALEILGISRSVRSKNQI